MNSLLVKSLITVVGASTISTAAFSQRYLWAMKQPAQSYQIGFESPYECDTHINAAADAWTASPDRFSMTWNSYFYGKITYGTPMVQVNFEPGSYMVNTGAWAEAPPGPTDGYFVRNGTSYW